MEGRDPSQTEPILVSNDWGGSTERRAFARYDAHFLLRVHDRARCKMIGQVCDIGLGGMRLKTLDPIPPARRYALSIEIRVDDVERPRIEVIARCAWHRARPDRQFEVGFEFVEMSSEARHRIAQFIDEIDR